MTFIKRIMVLILLTLSTVSCKVNVENYLIEDAWIIKEISYDGHNIKKEILINILVLEGNNRCRVPLKIKNIELMNIDDENGTWSLDDKNLKITINNNQEYINGTYDFCFGKDNVIGSVYMILKSDKLYIKAYKGNYGVGYKKKLPIRCDDNVPTPLRKVSRLSAPLPPRYSVVTHQLRKKLKRRV